MELNQEILSIFKSFLKWASADPDLKREISFKKEKDYFIFTLYSRETGFESVFFRNLKEAREFNFESFLSAVTLWHEHEKMKEFNEFAESQRKKQFQRVVDSQKKLFRVSNFD